MTKWMSYDLIFLFFEWFTTELEAKWLFDYSNVSTSSVSLSWDMFVQPVSLAVTTSRSAFNVVLLTSILGCCSQFGSCIWLPVADVLEQEVEMFEVEVAQTPHHTPATPSPLDEVPQILSILELENTHKGCDTLLLLKLVVKIVVIHGMSLKPPFHKIVYVGGNPVCQLTFHCRLFIGAFSSASTTSCMDTESELNTCACSWNVLLALNLISQFPEQRYLSWRWYLIYWKGPNMVPQGRKSF